VEDIWLATAENTAFTANRNTRAAWTPAVRTLLCGCYSPQANVEIQVEMVSDADGLYDSVGCGFALPDSTAASNASLWMFLFSPLSH
jgi:hypothetical protein